MNKADAFVNLLQSLYLWEDGEDIIMNKKAIRDLFRLYDSYLAKNKKLYDDFLSKRKEKERRDANDLSQKSPYYDSTAKNTTIDFNKRNCVTTNKDNPVGTSFMSFEDFEDLLNRIKNGSI